MPSVNVWSKCLAGSVCPLQDVEILKKAPNSPKTGAETVLKDDQALPMKVQEPVENLQPLPAILQDPQGRGIFENPVFTNSGDMALPVLRWGGGVGSLQISVQS